MFEICLGYIGGMLWVRGEYMGSILKEYLGYIELMLGIYLGYIVQMWEVCGGYIGSFLEIYLGYITLIYYFQPPTTCWLI